MSSTTDTTVADLAPSAKAVFLALHAHGTPQSTRTLAATTRLAPRTVRYSLDKLRAAGVVESHRHTDGDARRRTHHLTDEAPEAIPE